MKYYKAEEVVKCIADIVLEDLPTIEVEDAISREDAVNALIAHFIPQTYTGEQVEQASKMAWKIMANAPSVVPKPKEGEWIDCNEPPNTERNVFIAHGTDNMKSVCIGHYDHILKQWYEDRNFFAKPIYDGMYWCEIPEFPTIKGADTNCSENPNS